MKHLVRLQSYINAKKDMSLYRTRSLLCSWRLHFGNNDYLSLRDNAALKHSYQHGFKEAPIGGGGSMVVCGYHQQHKLLEKSFADALNVDDCIIFSSGYAANLACSP